MKEVGPAAAVVPSHVAALDRGTLHVPILCILPTSGRRSVMMYPAIPIVLVLCSILFTSFTCSVTSFGRVRRSWAICYLSSASVE